MATGDDAVQATVETARIGVSTVIEGVATGIIEIGAATPVVAPLCVALLKAKDVVEGTSRNKDGLQQLSARCDMITVQVIDRCRGTTPVLDVSPFVKCIEKLAEVAQRYHDQGPLARIAQFRRDGDDIQRLRDRIEAVVPIMGLTGVINIAEGVANIKDQLEDVQRMLARLQPRPALAPVPKGVPMIQSWHAVREGVVDRVCQILGGGQEPRLAALTGRSGAGKTTAAAAMVGGLSRIRSPLSADEIEDQTRTGLDRLRALFHNGVVWLRVGRGGGGLDRLRPLMHGLARAVHEDVMGKLVDAPAVGEDGESYVKKIVLQERLRCLVVADDVWDEGVVEKLRKTGMWVLMTTRNAAMVEPNERVVVDKLTQVEAEDVLRGAARLPPGERLCGDAMHVLEICGHVAMDIAFVGSWSCVRTADNGVPRSNGAWTDALRQVATQIDDLKARGLVENAAAVDDLDVNRRAVLRAGFKFLGAEDPLAQELYMMLAIFPDGHAFNDSHAAVLLNDEEPQGDHHMEVATSTITILERWAVVRADASGLYRMHDAHTELARGKLMDRGDVRRPAIRRWTSYISRMEIALGIDGYALLQMWRALEQVGGESLWTSRPYDDQLVQMDDSDRRKTCAANVVAELYEQGAKYAELEALMQNVLRDCDNDEDTNLEVKMAALFYIRTSLLGQGRYTEAEEAKQQLGEMASLTLKPLSPVCGDGFIQTSSTFNVFGVCAAAAGWRQEAEKWFRKALKVQEDGGLGESSQSIFTLSELGECVRKAGRVGEAEELLLRALKITKAKVGLNNLKVSDILHELGVCLKEAGRPGEAGELLKQALAIKEATLGGDDVQVAVALCEMGRCMREARRPGEAVELLKRALSILEAKLGANDVQVAHTLFEMGVWVRQAGRPGEAVELLRRSLETKEAKLGADDISVSYTLDEIGRCVREAGRPGEAVELLKRSRKTKEAKLGADDVQVAVTLHEMGECMRKAGRPGEAIELLKRAVEIQEVKLKNDDMQVAVTLHEMGLCVREAGQPGEGRELFKRALAIKEAKLGANDLQAAATLHEMGVCVREAGRPEEAGELLKRALDIEEMKLGNDALGVAVTLHEMARCEREAGRSGEAGELLKRALAIREAKLGGDDLSVAVVLHEMGVCVREAGQPREAEGLLKRALEITQAQLGEDNLHVAWILHDLDECTREAERQKEADGSLIKVAKVGGNHVSGRCVKETE